jgi:hypothetical protein
VIRFASILVMSLGALSAEIPGGLKNSLLLYAPFDGKLDAAYARGDPKIYSAPSYKEVDKALAGMGQVDAAFAPKMGVRGDALKFNSVNSKALFFKAAGNTKYSPNGWNGTASFWLRLDPDTDLKGFSDPVQITDKAYNDACIWVDFTKDERPRHFRLGVFGDLSAWNSSKLPADKNPEFTNRLVVMRKTPFSSNRWTHVAVTWSGLGSKSGSAKLYVDGQLVGTADSIREPFTWQPDKALIRLGVNYAGLFDELAIFDRPLSETEIGQLHKAAR